MPLISHLMGTLLLHKPDDPVAFQVRQIEHMINFRDNPNKPAPILFNNRDLVNVFQAIDFWNRGTIDMKQYLKGERIILD